MQASLNSLLTLDVDNPVDAYGGLTGIKTGLEQLNGQLSSNRITNPDQARYAASLVFLESKFANEVEMQSKVHNKIEIAQKQSEHFGVSHENVIANLAETLLSSIVVASSPGILNGLVFLLN